MINESKQKKALLIIIAILVLANAVTLVMLFTHKPFHKRDSADSHRANIVNYLKNDLGFNDTQVAAYDSLHKKHMDSVQKMFNDIRLEKEKRFKYLAAQNFSDSAITIAASTMNEKQNVLEIKMLRHLRELRSIGTPAQQAKFDTTFLTFMTREGDKNKRLKH